MKAAGTAAKSPAALQALSTDQVSLTDTAALAEFDDMPGALDRLVRDAGTQWFDHTVAQLREQQASMRAQQEAEKPWHERASPSLMATPIRGTWSAWSCPTCGPWPARKPTKRW